jgi:hypothetical protein
MNAAAQNRDDIEPDYDAMLAHLRHLFSCDLGKYADGLVEIAWTTVRDGKHHLNKARLFPVTNLQGAATEALLQNVRSNVYVGIALRKPGTDPVARASDADVYCYTSVVADLDDPGRTENAQNVWGDTAPTFAVVTGKRPHARMQCWWKLSEPSDDFAQFTKFQKTLITAFGADESIHDPPRVMRLAGSIAHPSKPGRVKEPTYEYKIKNPGAPYYPFEQLERKWPMLRVVSSQGAATAPTSSNSLGINFSRTDQELTELLEESRQSNNWHNPMVKATATMVGRGWSDSAIKLACAQYCNGGADDPDLVPLIDGARKKYGKPNVDDVAETPRKKLVITPFALNEDEVITPRDFIYGRHYIRKFASATVAYGGVGKSSLIIVEALAMATGKPLLGITVPKRRRVWLWNGEDPMDELKRRIRAACRAYGIKKADIEGYLFVDSGRDTPIRLATNGRDGLQIAKPLVDDVIEQAKSRQIDVMFIDPFISSHGVPENDNNGIDAVVKEWGHIADDADCSVELVHHLRKTGGKEATVEDARGASSLLAAVRSCRVLNTMSEDESERLGVEENRKLHFKVDNGKANMAQSPDKADWYQLFNVNLGNRTDPLFDNSDDVGVVRKWIPTDLLAGITPQHAEKVFAAVRGGEWRESSRSPDAWVGVPVAQGLGLDLARKRDKAVVKKWLVNAYAGGTLVKVPGKDKNRVDRVFVVVAEGV